MLSIKGSVTKTYQCNTGIKRLDLINACLKKTYWRFGYCTPKHLGEFITISPVKTQDSLCLIYFIPTVVMTYSVKEGYVPAGQDLKYSIQLKLGSNRYFDLDTIPSAAITKIL